MRHHTPQDNLTLAEVAVRYMDAGVGALDLAGDEALSTPATLPVEAFRLAAEQGLHRTVHAGEGAGPESIRLAIDLLGAERLGHGVRLREDPALMEEVRRRGIALEMCPTSNVQTSVVAAVAEHPIDDLSAGRAAGHRGHRQRPRLLPHVADPGTRPDGDRLWAGPAGNDRHHPQSLGSGLRRPRTCAVS